MEHCEKCNEPIFSSKELELGQHLFCDTEEVYDNGDDFYLVLAVIIAAFALGTILAIMF